MVQNNLKQLLAGVVFFWFAQQYLVAQNLINNTPDIIIDAASKTLKAPKAESYQWYLNGQKLEVATQNISATTAGNYSVELTSENGKVSTQSINLAVAENGEPIKIFTIGDSTVQDYSDGYYPRKGWGQMLQHFFDTAQVTVINKALGGTSSKSFYDNHWSVIKNSLEPGNFVFIQFGINDANKTDPARYTVASTTFKDYLTKFVEETQAAGAFPVIVATLRRNAWNADGTPYNAYHGYPVAARELAGELNVPLIDLDVKSKALMQQLGKAYVAAYWYMNLAKGEYPNFMNGNSDDVHFQEMGAIAMARLVTEEIKALQTDANVSTLIPHLKVLHELKVSADNDSLTAITRNASYPEGINVTLKVKPTGENVVDRWSALATDTVRASNKEIIYVTMPDSDESYTAHLLYGPDYMDCNGVFKGSAFVDNCGDCVGGNTIFTPCENDFAYDTVKIIAYETGLCLEANTKLTLEKSNADYNQKWVLESAADGSFYKLKNVQTGTYLDISSKNVSISSTGAMWRFEETDSALFQLVHKEDLMSAMNIFRAYILMATRNTKDSQKFKLEKTSIANDNTSVGADALVPTFTVSPNPFNTTTTINVPTGSQRSFSFFLYDISGQLVVEELGINASRLEIGANLLKGVYLGKIVSGSATKTIKIVKY